MSWLDVRSGDQFNRTGYLVQEDGTRTEFRFAYRGTKLVSENDAVTGLEMSRRMTTIETPSKLKFTLHSKIAIGDDVYMIGDIQDNEPSDQNGKWRSETIRVQKLNILKSI